MGDHEEIHALILKRLDDGFLHQGMKLQDLTDQWRQMNGRLAAAQERLGRHEEWMDATQDRIVKVEAQSDEIEDTLKTQERRLIVRDITIIGATLAFVAAVLEFFKKWL